MNDTFCQIEKCWRYAEKYGRHLIIDTNDTAFGEDFSYFFEAVNPSIPVTSTISATLLEELNQLSCLPSCVTGRISNYQVKHLAGSNLTDQITNEQLTFSFRRNYDTPLLVHHQCGGGELSHSLLRRIRLSPTLTEVVSGKLRELPRNYLSIHVRNTDYKTNYKEMFRYAKEQIEGGRDVLICSDSLKAVNDAIEYFGGTRTHTASTISDNSKIPLHHLTRDKSMLANNMVKSIVDLFALSNANVFIYKNLTGGFPSGFSTLAAYIFENDNIRSALLGHGDKPETGHKEKPHITAINYSPLHQRALNAIALMIRRIKYTYTLY